MTVENPPKLWAFAWNGGETVTGPECGLEASASEPYMHQRAARVSGYGEVSKPQAYVREDVAAEQTAAALRGEAHETTALRRERDAAVEHAAAFAEVSRIVGIAYEADGRPVVPGPVDAVLAEVQEILIAVDACRELRSERDALRRERDALLARVEALRSGVLDIRYAAYEVTLRGEGEHPAVVCARVLEADTAAAGKGVG
jgi:hypothetical protein